MNGSPDNYILPFFWQRGEDQGTIREEIARIQEAGIQALCVEARPHPDFVGPTWWETMDAILNEARSRGMKVWVFDDDHYPTGRAVGRLIGAPRELRRLFLREHHIDAIGPMKSASFSLRQPGWLDRQEEDDKLIGVTAARRHPQSGELTGELLDVSEFVHGDRLIWDVPEGFWRIFVMAETPIGGDPNKQDYVNYIVPESVRVLIDTVYERFYERYREDFGKTFAGFFSDEPGFYNDPAPGFDSKLGKSMPLPWSGELHALLRERVGPEFAKLLPLLWHEGGKRTQALRYTYMDLVSRLYAKHFAEQIGDWCRSHGVEYIGHLIEDNNAHTRLGVGAGHFFRALRGQDMSGVDVVLWQLVPGFDETPFTWCAGETDSEFFHYGLAKLASSLGHLDPKKKGRTVAEVFGAYGWAEGLKLMKWMTDHMLVRGVNHFIPHAFSQKEFPDPDCPPHLYARGQNPQFRYYRILNEYTNRMAHLLSGGRHVASVAVLYHAEAEWSGESMSFHKPVKELLRNQIDCDVVPIDYLLESAVPEEAKLRIHEETFDCLVIPYSEALPRDLFLRLFVYARQGLPLVFVDGYPVRSSEGEEVAEIIETLSELSKVRCVKLDELATSLKGQGVRKIEISGAHPYLRHYHYVHSDLDVHMFFNEHPYEEIKTAVELPAPGDVLQYDAFRNELFFVDGQFRQGRFGMSLNLSPYESATFIAGEKEVMQLCNAKREAIHTETNISIATLEGPWTLSMASSEQYPRFQHAGKLTELQDMSAPGRFPAFSGTFRYESQLDWTPAEGPVWLDLGEVCETAQVWVNDRAAGIAICPPYRFEVGSRLREGSNTIVIEVTNTLAKKVSDPFSRFAQWEPSGLIGPVRLIDNRS
nr:glycosylhydrolase-like jelly roll fold domain-containing protein [Cohnella zeiphila]